MPNGVAPLITPVQPSAPCSIPSTTFYVFRPDEPFQGGRVIICIPTQVAAVGPYTVTIVGPNGLVFDETWEGPRFLPSPVQFDATADRFPVGDYLVTARPSDPASGGEELFTFSLSPAASTTVLTQQVTPSTARVWVTGGVANGVVEVDFFSSTGAEWCVYRGSEPIATDANGVGWHDVSTSSLPFGTYYAFPHSSDQVTCEDAAFTVP